MMGIRLKQVIIIRKTFNKNATMHVKIKKALKTDGCRLDVTQISIRKGLKMNC